MIPEKWRIRRGQRRAHGKGGYWWVVRHSSLPAIFDHSMHFPTFAAAIRYVDRKVNAQEPTA